MPDQPTQVTDQEELNTRQSQPYVVAVFTTSPLVMQTSDVVPQNSTHDQTSDVRVPVLMNEIVHLPSSLGGVPSAPVDTMREPEQYACNTILEMQYTAEPSHACISQPSQLYTQGGHSAMTAKTTSHQVMQIAPVPQNVPYDPASDMLNNSTETEFLGIEMRSMEDDPDIADIDFTSELDTFNFLLWQRTNGPSENIIAATHFISHLQRPLVTTHLISQPLFSSPLVVM